MTFQDRKSSSQRVLDYKQVPDGSVSVFSWNSTSALKSKQILQFEEELGERCLYLSQPRIGLVAACHEVRALNPATVVSLSQRQTVRAEAEGAFWFLQWGRRLAMRQMSLP